MDAPNARGERGTLLVVQTDRALRRELEAMFAEFDVLCSDASEQALALVRRAAPDVVLFDLGPAREPALATKELELLRQILALAPNTKIIAMTEPDARELAVQAASLGAADFYHKPIVAGVLSIVVRRAFRIRELEEENWRLREQTGAMALEGIIGASDAMRSLCHAIVKVAPTSATALLLGESGTGKELLARALHRLSGRTHQPFVAINCAAIPDTLLESELFGYEKGAFTGASGNKQGLIEVAHKGILFLDELGEMDVMVQPKLLKVLEDNRFRRLGDVRERVADIQIVAATNRNLMQSVREMRFREDLYFRISTFHLRIPPLRERREDIPLIARSLLQNLTKDLARGELELSPAAEEVLKSYPWPGNIRELRNVLERIALTCDTRVIEVHDLNLASRPGATPLQGQNDPTLTLVELEKQHITRVLGEEAGRVAQAAARLGIPRSTLYQKIKVYGIGSETQQ